MYFVYIQEMIKSRSRYQATKIVKAEYGIIIIPPTEEMEMVNHALLNTLTVAIVSILVIFLKIIIIVRGKYIIPTAR